MAETQGLLSAPEDVPGAITSPLVASVPSTLVCATGSWLCLHYMTEGGWAIRPWGWGPVQGGQF